jgi:Asp-tRNA(Asn)/Glu-tRNA(Gln) amidotransferase A subunit family amidase
MTSTPITSETIAEAEKLLGVAYTEAERALMVEGFSEQIELAADRRAADLPHTLAPASRFDPRLPGWTWPQVGPFRPSEAPVRPLPAAEDIAFAPVTALSGWIKSRALTSVRLTEIYLERIQRLGPALECIVTVTEDQALDQARNADRLLADGIYLGPLHGIPWGAKDLLDTAGVPTGWGAEPYRDRVPATDAAVVEKLAAAGAVLIAKTAVGALAYGDVWYGGISRNPWNVEEGSSGSSAGSASATAAGLVGFSIGTETLGSIVSPSMRCGNTGLRPSFGRVSRAGAMPLCWSLDKIGPICRSVEDTALVLAAINGFDARDPGSIEAPFGYDADAPVAGRRVGYFAGDFEAPDAHDLDRAALDAARRLGLDLVPIERPDLPYDSLKGLLFAEAAAAFEELTLGNRDDELRRQDVAAWPNQFRKARFLSAVDHVQLDRLRRRVMVAMDGCFRGLDAIIGPSLVGPMLTITNFTGHPCLVLPAGFQSSPTRSFTGTSLLRGTMTTTGEASHTVPYGITLWGHLFDEGTILTIGRALEREFGVRDRRPHLG